MATKSWQKRCGEKTKVWSAHVEYCLQKGLNHHQFGYWKKKYTDKEKSTKCSIFAAIPVQHQISGSSFPPSRDGAAGGGIMILLPDNVKVHLAVGQHRYA